MCSPYLTGSLGIMLCLVTFNYWSVSTQNSDLVKKVEEMQQQLQLGSKHIQSLEEETGEIRKEIKKNKDKVQDEKQLRKEVETKYKHMTNDRDELKTKLDLITVMKTEGEESEKKLTEDKEMQDKAMDTLREELEEVKGRLVSAKEDITSCKAALASERAEKLLVPPQGVGGMPPRQLGRSDSLGPGQLADVNPGSVSVIKKETQGAGLTIVDDGLKLVDNALNQVAVSPNPKVEVLNLSSTKKPVSSSQGVLADGMGEGVVPAPKIVENEAGVMPLPSVIKTGVEKAGFENLDNAEDDSQIAQHENGREGKEEIEDDDQNPDGQIDETVDLDKQHYLVDKAAEVSGVAGDGAGVVETKEGVESSLENGVADNLDNLKESLNNVETQ